MHEYFPSQCYPRHSFPYINWTPHNNYIYMAKSRQISKLIIDAWHGRVRVMTNPMHVRSGQSVCDEIIDVITTSVLDGERCLEN